MKIADTLTYNRNSCLFDENNRTANLRKMSEAVSDRYGEAASVQISDEGQAALRDKMKQIKPGEEQQNIYDELVGVEDTNELEMEHYFAMREYSSDMLKDGNYNIEDVMKSMMDAYEARYNEIVKAHENGDREVNYDLAGKTTVTLEQDIAGLDKAFQRQKAAVEGYITCQQTSDGAKFFGKADTDKRSDAAKQKEYSDRVTDMLERAKERFKKMREQPDYKAGIGGSIMESIMGEDSGFRRKIWGLI